MVQVNVYNMSRSLFVLLMCDRYNALVSGSLVLDFNKRSITLLKSPDLILSRVVHRCSSFLVFMCFMFFFREGQYLLTWLQLSFKYLTVFCINMMTSVSPPNLDQYIIPRSHASKEFSTSYI